MNELSIDEIRRQDFVDNKIFELVNDVNPKSQNIGWNIEMIGQIRDVIAIWLTDELKVCSKKDFYPYCGE